MGRAQVRRLAPRRWAKVREVAAHLQLPDIPRRAHPAGAVWGVAMVKNEIDLLEACVRHQFDQGIDAMIISDNGSTDGTLALLDRLARELPIYIGHDTLPALEQATKMTRLGGASQRAGAGWVVPFDADEFWYGAGARNVGDTLRSMDSDVGIVHAPIHTAFPLQDVDAST